MKAISIYAGNDGWFYAVTVGSRLVIFGWCGTRERAEWQAACA